MVKDGDAQRAWYGISEGVRGERSAAGWEEVEWQAQGSVIRGSIGL